MCMTNFSLYEWYPTTCGLTDSIVMCSTNFGLYEWYPTTCGLTDSIVMCSTNFGFSCMVEIEVDNVYK